MLFLFREDTAWTGRCRLDIGRMGVSQLLIRKPGASCSQLSYNAIPET